MHLYRSEDAIAIQPYQQSSITASLNHSNLFNSMIYPFTRMVIYGSIWYQGKNNIILKFFMYNFDLIHIGEANIGSPNYDCKFAKMIQYWRQTWNERTNGITDIQFPFGFVQVRFTYNLKNLIFSYSDC